VARAARPAEPRFLSAFLDPPPHDIDGRSKDLRQS
jgi:hypothetical protein